MKCKVLVTGAGGHIGNNLVRALVRRGGQVTAGVRDPASAKLFDGLDCGTASIDLLDKSSLIPALRDIDTLYQVGAVFRHWAPDPERDIYQANLQGTRNIMEAAAENGVRRVIYVSSLASLDRSILPINENSWNPDRRNVYSRSKTDSEKLAWELADKLGLEMVSVLPGATVGMDCFRMTPTMGLLQTILEGELAVDPGFFFNFIHVEDVVAGMMAAAERGRPGERYLLANENAMSVREMVSLAREIFPERNIKTPPRLPRALLRAIAATMEINGRLRNTEPQLRVNYLSEFTRREECDISKARRELGFFPESPRCAVLRTLRYLKAARRPPLAHQPASGSGIEKSA